LAEKPTVVEVGRPLAVINGGFTPKALPKKGKPAPIAFGLSARVATADGSFPPALREVSLELDRHIAADAEGIAVCRRKNLEGPSPQVRCRSALVGKGTMDVLIHIPEQMPFIARSKLLAFNAGVKHGVPTILLYAYLASPVNVAVLTTVGVTKIDQGRYGMKWLFVFPRIADGYGSIANFNLAISKQFSYMGEEESYLLARCPDRHLDARATSVFGDGYAQVDSFVRSCAPKP
jgi:hypothetical protein